MPENDKPDSVLGKLKTWKEDGFDQMEKGGMPGEATLGNPGDFPEPEEPDVM